MFPSALSFLAPLYQVPLQQCAHQAQLEDHARWYERALAEGHFVLDRSAVPAACHERISAGALMGRALYIHVNPELGRSIFATLLKQINAVQSGQLFHAAICKVRHEEPTRETLLERLGRFLAQHHRRETTSHDPGDRFYQRPTSRSPVDDGLLLLCQRVGTETGLTLAERGAVLSYTRKRPSAALVMIRDLLTPSAAP